MRQRRTCSVRMLLFRLFFWRRRWCLSRHVSAASCVGCGLFFFLGGLGGRGGGGTPRGGLHCCASWLLGRSPAAALVGLARDGPLEGGRAHPRGPACVCAADRCAAASSRVASAASAVFPPVCAGRLVHGGVRATMMARATGSASALGALKTRSFASLLRTRTCNANERRKEIRLPRRHRDTPRTVGR